MTTRENYDEGLPGGMMFCDGIAMLRDRILAIRETQVYEPRSWRHFVGGVRILGVDGDVVRCRAKFLVTEAVTDEEPRLFLVGRSLESARVALESVPLSPDVIYVPAKPRTRPGEVVKQI